MKLNFKRDNLIIKLGLSKKLFLYYFDYKNWTPILLNSK